MQQFLSCTLLIISILLTPFHTAFAQSGQSDCVITKVGSPSIPPALPAECYTTPSSGPTGSGGDHPIAPPCPGDCRQAVIDKFGVTMNNFNQTQLVWAWEKLWDVSNTRFDELIRGTVITGINGMSEQTGCNEFRLRNSTYMLTEEVLFKIIFSHESGHVIRNCALDGESKRTDHEGVFVEEGGCTEYGAQACYGGSAVSEDYSEMIAYYLNPGQKEQSASCQKDDVPFADGKFPKHYKLAQEILGQY